MGPGLTHDIHPAFVIGQCGSVNNASRIFVSSGCVPVKTRLSQRHRAYHSMSQHGVTARPLTLGTLADTETPNGAYVPALSYNPCSSLSKGHHRV